MVIMIMKLLLLSMTSLKVVAQDNIPADLAELVTKGNFEDLCVGEGKLAQCEFAMSALARAKSKLDEFETKLAIAKGTTRSRSIWSNPQPSAVDDDVDGF